MRDDARANLGTRRGRPPVAPGERSVSLSVTLPESVYDRLTRLAAQEHIDLAPLVRRVLGEFSTEKLSAQHV